MTWSFRILFESVRLLFFLRNFLFAASLLSTQLCLRSINCTNQDMVFFFPNKSSIEDLPSIMTWCLVSWNALLVHLFLCMYERERRGPGDFTLGGDWYSPAKLRVLPVPPPTRRRRRGALHLRRVAAGRDPAWVPCRCRRSAGVMAVGSVAAAAPSSHWGKKAGGAARSTPYWIRATWILVTWLPGRVVSGKVLPQLSKLQSVAHHGLVALASMCVVLCGGWMVLKLL
jgi:hypothetical protein